MSFILAIDLDGVVADWVGGVKRRFELMHPDKVLAPIGSFRNYYLQEDYPQWKEELREVASSAGLYSGLEVIPGATEALKDIEENCGDYITPFLCSTPDTGYERQLCFTEKAAWVEKHLGKFWVDRLILTQDKTVVYADALIDDKPDITGALEPVWSHVLYAQSYNAHVTGSRFTWQDWPEFRDGSIKPYFADHIEKLESEQLTSKLSSGIISPNQSFSDIILKGTINANSFHSLTPSRR